jgi:hypothetical protein
MASDGKHTADRRRALALLAGSSDGCTTAILLAHDVTFRLMVELADAKLATVVTERAGGSEHARMKITDEGRRELAEG